MEIAYTLNRYNRVMQDIDTNWYYVETLAIVGSMLRWKQVFGCTTKDAAIKKMENYV